MGFELGSLIHKIVHFYLILNLCPAAAKPQGVVTVEEIQFHKVLKASRWDLFPIILTTIIMEGMNWLNLELQSL